MVQVKERVDGLELDVPANAGEEASDENGPLVRHMPFDQHTLERMADQLANILETLKTREVHRPPHAQDTTQGSEVTNFGPPKTYGLSCRQVEILGRVAEGMSNKLIAAQLHVSDQTIKNHMTHILDRLYANDRTHAVVLAFRLGLLDLEGGTSQ